MAWGNPSINFEQQVASTCPEIECSVMSDKFGSVFIKIVKWKMLSYNPVKLLMEALTRKYLLFRYILGVLTHTTA